MTTTIFYRFLRFCVIPRLRPGDVLIMDNLAAHRSERIGALLKSSHVLVIYTPPYSPEYNPIEMVWNSLKRRLEKQIERYLNRIAQGVAAAWRSLKNPDMGNLMTACGYLT